MSIKVSIDASGGDFGFPVTINAGINALKAYDDLMVNLSLIHISDPRDRSLSRMPSSA